MGEHEGGDSGKLGAFLLGFLVGVLVCLGAGGTFVFVRMHHGWRSAEEAMMHAEMAEEARARAEIERVNALRALEAAKLATEKPKQ